MIETILHLTPAFFSERERVLVEHGPLTASTFRYDSGVCALRLKNDLGELVMLPFQGQQIWSAVFGGRDLTMKSMFTEPSPTRTYLENYGGFLLHCGVTAMGVPAGADTHPLHGELPNAPYQQASLSAGEDARGAYLALLRRDARAHLSDVARRMTYLELSADNTFYDAFMSAMFLPHTDMTRFPTVEATLAQRV